jgi:hypothetical protein
MSESINVELHAYDKVKKLGVRRLMMLPYRSSSHVTQNYMTDSPSSTSGASPDNGSHPATPVASSSDPPKSRVSTSAAASNPTPKPSTVIVAITMLEEEGICSWHWYEATIETLAVGVYLYATFVLTSMQFLSGNTGLAFVTIIVLCSSMVRLLVNIF